VLFEEPEEPDELVELEVFVPFEVLVEVFVLFYVEEFEELEED
jgi:hypothetical protein